MMPPYLRLVHRIRAEDCPNVQDALVRTRRGLPLNPVPIISGAITWEQYRSDRLTLPGPRQTVQLDADWYEGPEERLTPDSWLVFANEHAKTLPPRRSGRKWLGVDCGEGGDDSAWCVGDRLGVLDIFGKKTPDTHAVYGTTIMVARKWGVDWQDVIFDYGGGGKEHVDRLRNNGMPVRGLRFGAIKREVKRAMTQFTEKREVEEDTAGYSNRRSEMAWGVRMLLERPAPDRDPELVKVVLTAHGKGTRPVDNPPYGLPVHCCGDARIKDPNTLVGQLAVVPAGGLDWDDQGRFRLMPKNPPKGNPDDPRCFKNKLGRSPDLFDAFCLMVWGMNNEPQRATAGAG